ncbi:MAG TPA: hypothetical protein ENH53_13075, partial [Bacteroidetes bacterium]|nr:hypothetical protein [Bacteroidota bacterium]
MKEAQKKEYEGRFEEVIQKLSLYCKRFHKPLVRRAFDFAFESHKHQLRKSGEPYIVHCIEV